MVRGAYWGKIRLETLEVVIMNLQYDNIFEYKEVVNA